MPHYAKRTVSEVYKGQRLGRYTTNNFCQEWDSFRQLISISFLEDTLSVPFLEAEKQKKSSSDRHIG